jgi:transcriptional regulator with XRE-family HTH domain
MPTVHPDLASSLNAVRKRLRLSISDVAERLGVSRSLAGDLFTGKRSPTPDQASHLIEVLELEGKLAEELEHIGDPHYVSTFGGGSVRLDTND